MVWAYHKANTNVTVPVVIQHEVTFDLECGLCLHHITALEVHGELSKIVAHRKMTVENNKMIQILHRQWRGLPNHPFVIPSTYHLLLLLDKHWLLAPKPCQSCCSAVRHGCDHQFHTVFGGFKPTWFLRKFLVKRWFSRCLLGDLYRKESGNPPHSSDDENCRIYADSPRTWKAQLMV